MADHNTLERDFCRMNIANFAPKQYSPTAGKKIAPVVPPKPKRMPPPPVIGSSNNERNDFRGNNGSVAESSQLEVRQSNFTVGTPYADDATMTTAQDQQQRGKDQQRHNASLAVAAVLQSRLGKGFNDQQQSSGVINTKPRPFGHQSPTSAAVPPYLLKSSLNGPDASRLKYANGNAVKSTPPTAALTSLHDGVIYDEGHASSASSAAASAASPRISNYANDLNYVNTANYSNPSNYSNSSNYSNASNYSNMANYSDSSNYSNSSNYSDFSNYDHCHPPDSLTSYGAFTPTPPEDDLPPPPPPEPSSYSPLTNHNFPPPPPEEFPPPPSPVSSSYSELRRAAHQVESYANYGPVSSQSSTYESIYEPIHPRPQSQMSNRSLYSTGSSLYAPYGISKGKIQGSAQHISGSVPGTDKENQVDVLTNLLVQSMENSSDPDFFGICGKCDEKVTSEQNGCTAMEQVFHVACFTCFVCQTPLQGKPFYALDGKPYCEDDYLNTLEKCSVCMEPILDRILRATGKPYHPKCFTCVVCGKSLDGIPFTVDAANQIHCIEDFHKKFAPRCCVCKLPIMPEQGKDETVRVVALDKSFHVNCYKCEDCGLILSSEAEGRGCYPLDDHILCKSCNAKRVQLLTSHMGN